MARMGAVPMTLPGLQQAFLSTIANPTIWLGILFLISYTLCYMTAVSWADYSYVMPAGAFGYALQTILAVLILHEVVVAKRWAGVALIVLGVLLVGQTKPSTTSESPAAP
jgi:drug/metabolite transporter (DMT)-like permease